MGLSDGVSKITLAVAVEAISSDVTTIANQVVFTVDARPGSPAGEMIIQRPTYHIASFTLAALLAKCLPHIQARLESEFLPQGVQLQCEERKRHSHGAFEAEYH